MIEFPGAIVSKFIKRSFPDRVVSADFKKEFSKALSLFIFFIQSGISKKKYGREDILEVLEKEGLGKVAEDLRTGKRS